MILKLELLGLLIALVILVWQYFKRKDSLNSQSKIFFGLGAVIILGSATLLYVNAIRNYNIQKLAASYNIGGLYTSPIDINLLDSYEKDAKTVQILEIKGSICEMPMIKVNGNWKALGITCRS